MCHARVNALSLLLVLVSGCGRPDPTIRNVVLVSLDTLGAKHVGAYGYERDTTPTFDRLAAEGTLFAHAYTPQVWTMTAHLSMMTGLYPLAHGAATEREASPAATSLASILSDEGFATAAFMGAGGFAGPDYGLGRGFEKFRTGWSRAEWDNELTFAWLREQASHRASNPDHRFFLLAHYFDVHSDSGKPVPYAAPQPFQLRYLPDGLNWRRRGDSELLARLEVDGVEPSDVRVLTALYDGGVRYADERGLGPLVDELESLDLLDETLLIVTSDHGEEIFEHGAAFHQQPYEETARVPLLLRGPGIPRGRRIDALVELVDLMPTVLSLLDLPTPEHVQGRDLSPALRSDRPLARGQAHVDGLFGAVPPHLLHKPSSLIREIDGVRWSYVNTVHVRDDEGSRRFEIDGPGELYRLDRDPEQRQDLAAEHPELAQELGSALLAWYERNEALRLRLHRSTARKIILDDAEREQLRALGYAFDP